MIPFERVASTAPLWGPAFVLVVAGLVGATLGLGPALLVIAAGMLVAAIAGLWSSLGRLTGESPLTLEEAVGLGAPSPEEERKRSVLRALKDLEYERSVGKISEADFAELTQRYRAEAKHLLQAIAAEDAPRRKRAEEQLAARLKSEGVAASAKKNKRRASAETKSENAAEEPVEAEASPAPEDSAPASAPPVEAKILCPSCSTRNDRDSSFCKRCGGPLAAGAAS